MNFIACKLLVAAALQGFSITAKADFFSELFKPEPGKQAAQIVKEQLRSPSSFQYVDSEVLWKGKTKSGAPAYVVFVKYDAQNSFGAMLRGCMAVAYSEASNNKLSWNSLYGVKELDNILCNLSLPVDARSKFAISLAKINFHN